jgi:hypothetical protein
MSTMKTASVFLLGIVAIGILTAPRAEGAVRKVSICDIQKNPESFLHTKVEILNTLRLNNTEHNLLHEGSCVLNFAFGDDYQTFGDRYSAKKNAQWRLMRSLLINSNNKNDCPFFVRAIKARFRGVVERVPATGTIPPDEMPVEIIFRSVSHVEAIPIHCVDDSSTK